MYLAKPAPRGGRRRPADDPYLRALDETALALLDRRDSTILLETILTRACALLGTPHGYIYLAEPDGDELVLRHGTGLFAQGIGHRQRVDEGLGGEVYLTGTPVRRSTTTTPTSGARRDRARGHARRHRRGAADLGRRGRRRHRTRVGVGRADRSAPARSTR